MQNHNQHVTYLQHMTQSAEEIPEQTQSPHVYDAKQLLQDKKNSYIVGFFMWVQSYQHNPAEDIWTEYWGGVVFL